MAHPRRGRPFGARSARKCGSPPHQRMKKHRFHRGGPSFLGRRMGFDIKEF